MKRLPRARKDHPVLATYQRLLDALGALQRRHDDVLAIVEVGPQGARLMGVPPQDWADPLATTLIPITDLPGTAHTKMERGALGVLVASLAMDWHKATQAVPGLGDLCGTGFLAVQAEAPWNKDKFLLSWTPKAFAGKATKHSIAAADHPMTNIFLDAMAKAVALAGKKAPNVARLAVFDGGSTRDHSTTLGDVRSTPALVRAMEPMLTNDFHGVGRSLDIGHTDVRVQRDEVFEGLLAAVPTPSEEAIAAAVVARDAWIAHLRSRIPRGLKRMKFQAKPAVEVEIVHLRDEQEDNDNADADCPPFSDDDRAWLDHAEDLWERFVATMPANGLWTAAGISAWAYIERWVTNHDQDWNVASSHNHITFDADVTLQGQGVKDFNTQVLPTCWFLPCQGDAYLVRFSGQTYATRVKARSPQEAAVLAWKTYENVVGKRKHAQVWRQA